LVIEVKGLDAVNLGFFRREAIEDVAAPLWTLLLDLVIQPLIRSVLGFETSAKVRDEIPVGNVTDVLVCRVKDDANSSAKSSWERLELVEGNPTLDLTKGKVCLVSNYFSLGERRVFHKVFKDFTKHLIYFFYQRVVNGRGSLSDITPLIKPLRVDGLDILELNRLAVELGVELLDSGHLW
jgi:hypothetical protein